MTHHDEERETLEAQSDQTSQPTPEILPGEPCNRGFMQSHMPVRILDAMLDFVRDDARCTVLARSGSHSLAELVRMDDGTYYCQFLATRGFLPDWAVKQIADEMARLNAPAYAHYAQELAHGDAAPRDSVNMGHTDLF